MQLGPAGRRLDSVYGLIQLLRGCGELGSVVEVGSYRGVSTETLLLFAVEVTAVDPWQGLDAVYQQFLARVRPYPHVTIVRMRSVEAAAQQADRSLDLVYIDGAHDEASVRADLLAWQPKVRAGGWLAGHDYSPLIEGGAVMRVVDEVVGPPHQDVNLTSNIALVASRYAQAVDERQAIASERAACSRDDLIRLLGADLNAELVAHRKQRPQITPANLAGVCDRVGELASQLQDLIAETDDTIILATLRLATRELVTLEADYAAATATDRHLTIAEVAAHGPAWRAQLACATATDERRREAIARLDALLEDPLVRQLVVDARSSSPST